MKALMLLPRSVALKNAAGVEGVKNGALVLTDAADVCILNDEEYDLTQAGSAVSEIVARG